MVRSSRLLALAFAFTTICFGRSAEADIFVVPVSADTSPYSFLPGLARGSSPTLYAFTAVDESSTFHDFETYLRFDVSQADLPPGHVLAEANLLVTYAFDFTGFGEPSIEPGEIACHEVLEAWDSATLTWLDRPAIDDPFDVVEPIDDFGAVLCDATAIVVGWITDQAPNDGFALTNTTERVIGLHASESSADPSLMPQLILRTELPEPGLATALSSGGLALAWATRRRARSNGVA